MQLFRRFFCEKRIMRYIIWIFVTILLNTELRSYSFLFRHGLTRLFLKGTAWSARFFCFICYRLYYCIDTALSKWKDGKIERWKNKLSRELAQASRKCEAP